MITMEKIDQVATAVDNFIKGLLGQRVFNGIISITVDGVKILEKGYGMASFEFEIPNDPKFKYRIGSITKQFTAVAILQLFEEGLLSLEDTLNKYIADYPRGDEITIHHLLCHTAGVFNYTNDPEVMRNLRREYKIEELIECFKNLPLDFNPGEKFNYSNSGYVLLGYIVEIITKMEFEDYLQQRILDKVGLKEIGYDNHRKLLKNRATGYSLIGENQELQICEFLDTTSVRAAGAMYSTAEDLHKWNHILQNGRILKKETVDLMCSNQSKEGHPIHGAYGYGVFVADVEVTGKVIKRVMHSGGIHGFISYNTIFPSEKLEIETACNIESRFVSEHNNQIEKIVLQQLYN